MPLRDRRKRLTGVFATAAAVWVVGAGCASANGPLHRAGRPTGAVTGGPAPYTTMRPIFGWASPRPLYLGGYAGYNYSRAPVGNLVETAHDDRYERDFPPHLLGGHRRRH